MVCCFLLIMMLVIRNMVCGELTKNCLIYCAALNVAGFVVFFFNGAPHICEFLICHQMSILTQFLWS